MKFWTIQKRAVLDKVMDEGCYQPDFSLSGYAQKKPHLDRLYDLVLDAFNRHNHTSLPGLVFAFAATDNTRIESIPDIYAFHDYMCSNSEAVEALWNTLCKEDMVIMELNYPDDFNPIFIDINDFQFLMPPIMLLPPYTKEDVSRLLELLNRGQVMPSVFPSGIMQAHLPCIRRENFVEAFEVFPLE